MKLLLALVLLSLSAPAFAANNPYLEGLLNVKEALLNNDNAGALKLVNQLIALNPAQPQPDPQFQIFTRSRVTYYSGWIDVPNNNPQRCTWQDRQNVLQTASEQAMADCTNANLKGCQITGSSITKDGTLDYSDVNQSQFGNAVYTGCIGTATAKGFQ